jgi:hypothetical protein
MKKLLIILSALFLSLTINAQTTNKDIIISKTTPMLGINGLGGYINFYNGDVLLTQSSNLLTLTGGNLSLGTTNSLYGISTLGIGTLTPLHKLSLITTRLTSLNAFNYVMSDLNINRSTVSQARDTSSLNLWFTYTGSPLLTMTDKNGNVLLRADSIGFGVGTATPLTKLSVISSTTTNLNAFNFVQSAVNKRRDTYAQATDSSSITGTYSYTGSPTFNIVGKTGNSLFHVDSVTVGLGTTTPQHKLAVITSSLTKLNAFNFVNTINKRRDDPQQAADSASFNLSFSNTGSPMLSLRSKGGTNLLYIDSSKVTTTLDFGYAFKHAVGSADSVNWSTGTVQNYYYKINTTAFNWRENVGFTAAGDSIRILTAGDYKFHIWLNATTSNANDQMKVKMWVNNSALGTPLGMFKINSNGTGNGEVHYFMYYRTMAANDYVCFRICNLTAGRACVISDYKLYVEKVPE